MNDRASIAAFIRREAEGRYAHAPHVAEALERLAQMVELEADRAPPEPTLAEERTNTSDHWQ